MYDDEREERLIAKAQAGDAVALEELINQYTPAMKSAVRKVIPFLNVDDAIQTARLRFIELVMEHEQGDGHLTGRIKEEIQWALREESTLNNSQFHIPTRTQRRFLTIMRKAGNDVLTGADLAEVNGMARSTFLMISNVLTNTQSMDADPEWLDVLYGEQEFIDLETAAMAQQALDCLQGDERYVVEAFYGFSEYREFTDAEIAHALGKTKKQVRTLRLNALHKMRKALLVVAA